MSAPEKAPEGRRSLLAKVLFASSFGTIMEYFDSGAYGIAAAVAFPSLFFGPLGPAVGAAIALASTLLVSVGRPIGGIIFGHMGDTRGRTNSLVAALVIMGLATLGIGLLPTYAEIGVIAPALLFTFRVIQGIGLGGEWGGALTWAREHVGKSKWSGLLTGGVIQTAPGWGTLLSGAAATIIILATGQTFFAAPWGSWRYIFYIGSLLLAIAAVIRLRLLDSPIFLMLKSAGRTLKSPVSVALKKYWVLILALSLTIGATSFTFPVQTYSLAYLRARNFPVSTATLAISLGGGGAILATILFGFLADKLGRKRAGLLSTIFLLAMVYPYYYSLTTLDPTIVIVGSFLMLSAYNSISGVFPSFFTESFPAEVRTTGAGLALQITNIWTLIFSFAVWTPIIATLGPVVGFPYVLLIQSIWLVPALILWAAPYLKETKGQELS